MPMRRNRPKRESFNQAASLPFQLRIDDFEIADLTKYQADDYPRLNRALRSLELLTTADFVIVRKIDSAIARAAIPRDTIVYRGFRRNVVNHLELGDTFTDHGFSSCSLSETVVRDRFAYGEGAIFQFVARKGTHAIYLDSVTNFPKPELEILLPRGSSFRILSKEIRHGITNFMVNLISPSPTTNRPRKRSCMKTISSNKLLDGTSSVEHLRYNGANGMSHPPSPTQRRGRHGR
jgi:ADP-ribosyltransferase exoenzyme